MQNNWDKLNHILAFATLYILFTLSFKKITFYQKVFILILFGLGIEIIQYFIPSRDFSVFDIIADFIGIIFGFLVLQFLQRALKVVEF